MRFRSINVRRFMLGCLLLSFTSLSHGVNAQKKQEERDINIIQKPIVFDEQREKLSLEYLKIRYNMIKKEAKITPKLVVVHWTAIDSLAESFNVFNSPLLPAHRTKISAASQLNVSAHYLIDRDGTIYQLLPNTTFARHVIGLNHSAIGIENVGNGSTMPLTSAQLKANIKLISHLNNLFSLEYVIGHYEYVNFVNHALWKETNPAYLTVKSDPGLTFINDIRKALAHLSFKAVPTKE